ncbi:MAG: beta-propeller fold lactonase family protein [Vicinamibacterales bacterium]
MTVGRHSSFWSMLACTLASVACGGAGSGPRAYVTSELTGVVSTIDVASHRVLTSVATHGRARGLALDPHGARAYVGLSPLPTPTLGGVARGGIAIVDLGQARVIGFLDGPTNTQQLALSAPARRLFAPDDGRGRLGAWDTSRGAEVDAASWPETGEEPEAVAVSPDGRTVWVTSEGTDSVTAVDARSMTVRAHVAVGKRPRGIAFAPRAGRVYVSAEGDGSIAAIDEVSSAVVQRLTLARPASGPEPRPVGVAVSPDETELYVATGRAGRVVVLGAADGDTRASIQVGARPWHLALTPDGRTLFVANGPSDDVSVVDVKTRAVVDTIHLEGRPWGIAIR